MNLFYKIKHPELYHGNPNKKRFFEGWYFKQVTSDALTTIAFIPGISLDDNDAHAFVQVIQSPNLKTYYYRFPIGAFRSTNAPFSVSVGDNTFTLQGFSVNLTDFKGSVTFGKLTEIDKNWFCPNIMGYFAYLPGMECNHGVLSMSHQLEGKLQTPMGAVDFSFGKGYIEKDWGVSFPEKYIWIHTNHLKSSDGSYTDASLMLSVATIPMKGFEFQGLIANLHLYGKEYRFGTYNGSKIILFQVSTTQVHVVIRRGQLSLEFIAEPELVEALKAPDQGKMARIIKEGLNGMLTLKLKEGNDVLADLQSSCVGIEIAY